uniref:DDE-1 domain-containing protein n=1 Tax=Acanthochromis polyacanthus TaxID=80966 RepID=A0A3Q1GPH8_9TELE
MKWYCVAYLPPDTTSLLQPMDQGVFPLDLLQFSNKYITHVKKKFSILFAVKS